MEYWGILSLNEIAKKIEVVSYSCIIVTCDLDIWSGYVKLEPHQAILSSNLFILHQFRNKLSAYINHAQCLFPWDITSTHAILCGKLITGLKPGTFGTRDWCSTSATTVFQVSLTLNLWMDYEGILSTNESAIEWWHSFVQMHYSQCDLDLWPRSVKHKLVQEAMLVSI